MEKKNGIATLGELHNNRDKVSGLVDLHTTRSQLERWKQQASDEKNAKAELGEVLGKINRMVGGNGWKDPNEVIAAVAERLKSAPEMETRVIMAGRVEQELKANLELERKRLTDAQEQARTALTKLHAEQIDHNKLKERFQAQQEELNRMGSMQVAAPKDMTDEEREALLNVIQMNREDHEKTLRETMQAAANAADEVRKAELPMMAGSRSINYFNRGLLLGAAAVETAVARVIQGIKPSEPG